MLRTLFFIILLASALVDPSYGQSNGNGNGNGKSDNGNSHSNSGNSGNGQGSNNGNGPDSNSSGGQGNGNSGQGSRSNNGAVGNGQTSTGSGATSGNAGSITAASDQSTTLSQNQAVEAVERGAALPLAAIMQSLGERSPGEVVDASLLQVGSTLVYAVKVLSPAGFLSMEYYYARSGRFIGSE